MPIVPLLLLALFAAMLAWFVYNDGREYRRFKALTETRDRQRTYALWFAKSFLAFGMGSLMSLALLGDLKSLNEFPPAFASLLQPLRTKLNEGQGVQDFLIGFAFAIIVGFLVGALILRIRRRGGKPRQIVVGDIQPLLPRNAAERWWAVILSLNAGLSEELFFRLALPLLLVLVIGNAALAFVIATAIFGLMHLYQGYAGVIATTVVGAVMSGIYLATGDIWIVVILHAAIDLNGLVVMPYVTRAMREGQ